MELITTISSVLTYFSIALVAVVITSYIFFKVVKSKEENEEKKINQEREFARQYILKQRNYLANARVDRSTDLNQKSYSAPSYSEQRIEDPSRISYAYSDTTIFRNSQQRYIVLNKANNTNSQQNQTHKPRELFVQQEESNGYKQE